MTLALILGFLALATGGWYWLIGILLFFDLLITRLINWPVLLPAGRIRIPIIWHLIIWVFFNVWFIRTFLISSLSVVNPGMQPVFDRGDHVIISKMHYGLRLPITPVNFPFSHQYIPFSRCMRSYSTAVELTYKRLKPVQPIERGQLIAYNFPEGDSAICGVETMSYYALKRLKESQNESIRRDYLHYRPIDRRELEVSRCVGLPGDTVRVRRGEILVNEQPYPHGQVRYDYLVETRQAPLPRSFLHQLGLDQTDITIFPDLGYAMPLFPDQVGIVMAREQVSSVSPWFVSEGKPNMQIFPHHEQYSWNRDYFGPVIVPGKGMEVRLTLHNLPIYERIIRVYEKNHLEVIDGVIFIDGQPVDSYVIKQNYFFVAGDNRHHSRDSRHWGFLPEDHVLGKPAFIWLSLRHDALSGLKPIWNRFFKTPK